MLITDKYDPGAIADIPVGTTPTISYFEEFKVDPKCDDTASPVTST